MLTSHPLVGKILSMPFYTYTHSTPEGRIFYVGKGKGGRAYSKKDRNRYWHNLVSKYGYEVEIHSYWSTDAEAIEHEKELIAQYRKEGLKLVNMTDGGEGHSGFTKSAETKAKLSASLKGRLVSQETREKIRAKHLGKLVSESTKEKLRLHNLGKIHSEETKQKISESSKGRVFSEESKAKIRGENNPMMRENIREKQKKSSQLRSQDLDYRRKLSEGKKRSELMHTRKNSRLITFDGVTLTLSQWSNKLGLSKNTLDERLKRGWALEKALTSSAQKRGLNV